MRRKEAFALSLGVIGIFILDLAFNGSQASDLFYPPQLRNALPPQLRNASLPPTPQPPQALGVLPPGQNLYLYMVGGAFLAVAMIFLILLNRNPVHGRPD